MQLEPHEFAVAKDAEGDVFAWQHGIEHEPMRTQSGPSIAPIANATATMAEIRRNVPKPRCIENGYE